MQRWWISDDKTKPSYNESKSKKSSARKEVGDKKWIFSVLANVELISYEKIAMTGDSEALGNWDPDNCVILQNIEGTNVWSSEQDIPSGMNIRYRYFIASIDPTSQAIHVRRWETHLKPRMIPLGHAQQDKENSDVFGIVNGIEKIDKGWLTNETILQFKFINNPFALKDRIKNKKIFVKLTPMNLRINAETSNISNIEESLSNDTKENGSEQVAYALTEVATLNSSQYNFEQQEQFGRAYNTNDILIFNVTVTEPENVAYLIDMYSYSSRAYEGEPPYHMGYHYLLPNLLKKSEGNLELPITCASKHRPLGMMNVEFVKITPLESPKCDMKISYIRHWNKKWSGLDVGHRGSGTSFKSSDGGVIRENTIASLKKAATAGADMVEFDVQLSKDLVPVIYHDFQVYVSLKKKKTLDVGDMLELPMKELTLEQLKNLKIYHLVEGRTREAKFFDEDLDEHQPFPTLSDALEIIDPHVGFNIEVKWSMVLVDGSTETQSQIDKNLYVDCILDVVLAKGGNRRIVFSCFDPDVCTMLRSKQNLYPVMFLTLGVTNKYKSYLDPRCNQIEMAVKNACANELLGIVAHTEDLLRDQSQINLATDRGLVLFCWGDDNNDKDTIKHLKSLGIHAIIYDKVDILSSKGVKESVFFMEAKESQREIFEMIEYEQRMENSTIV